MKKINTLLTVILACFAITAAVCAEALRFPDDIRTDRNVIELKAGEQAEYHLTFVPDNALTLHSAIPSEEGIVAVDTEKNTITALRHGRVRLFFDSLGHTVQTCITVIVEGEADPLSGKAALLTDLQESDLGKVRASGLKSIFFFSPIRDIRFGTANLSTETNTVFLPQSLPVRKRTSRNAHWLPVSAAAGSSLPFTRSS